MRVGPYLMALALAVPVSAQAATGCETSFRHLVDPKGTERFTAEAHVADLAPGPAIAQMRGIALSERYEVLHISESDGSMLLEWPAQDGHKAVSLLVVATPRAKGEAAIRIEARLPDSLTADDAGARAELCGMLNQIKGGAAGVAAAQSGRTAAPAVPPISIDAIDLSFEVSRETAKRPDLVPTRYLGKTYTIRGKFSHVVNDGQHYRISFLIPQLSEMAFPPLDGPDYMTEIVCLAARGQGAYAMSLVKGDRITLTGQYHDYNEFKHIIWFANCQPAA